MKPIFTIHAGEYLVGNELEKQFPNWEVWIPSRDTGVDLLLRHPKSNTCKTIQVKFSKSWTETHTLEQFRKYFRTQGWWTLNRDKLEKSAADYWVLALYSFDNSKNDFLIFQKEQLVTLYKNLDRWDKKMIQTYFWTLKNGMALEGRSLKKDQIKELVQSEVIESSRDVTDHLNNWELLI